MRSAGFAHVTSVCSEARATSEPWPVWRRQGTVGSREPKPLGPSAGAIYVKFVHNL